MSEALCPWDFYPVTNKGDTCDRGCYSMWYGFMYVQATGNLLELQPDDTPPNPEWKQPWSQKESLN